MLSQPASPLERHGGAEDAIGATTTSRLIVAATSTISATTGNTIRLTARASGTTTPASSRNSATTTSARAPATAWIAAAALAIKCSTLERTVWAAAIAAIAAAERDKAAAVVAARKADLEASLAAQRQAEQLADRQRRRRDALQRKAELEAGTPEIERLYSDMHAAAEPITANTTVPATADCPKIAATTSAAAMAM